MLHKKNTGSRLPAASRNWGILTNQKIFFSQEKLEQNQKSSLASTRSVLTDSISRDVYSGTLSQNPTWCASDKACIEDALRV